jgi:dolichol-phosphate mannosyltransferase
MPRPIVQERGTMSATTGSKHDISIIVPVLNEVDGIRQLREKLTRVRALLSEIGNVELVLVDDGSTDGTLASLRDEFAEGDQCRIVAHSRNRGVGAAFRTGFQNATGNIICTIDADCSYEPEGLKRLIDAILAGADIATASPYHPAGSVQDVASWRLLLSRACSVFYRMISPVSLYTYTSIFRAYRSIVVETIRFESDGFVSAAEILIRAAERGYRISEVPMILRGRKVGTTKMKIARNIRQHLIMQGRVLLQRLDLGHLDAANRPLTISSVPGPVVPTGAANDQAKRSK